jgi:hypothetical protein
MKALQPKSIWGLLALGVCLAVIQQAHSQALDFTATRAEVNFNKTLQPWDGFGLLRLTCTRNRIVE